MLVSCGSEPWKQQAEVLDTRAYRLRYVSVDSVLRLAEDALALSSGRDADAMTHLAYVSYQRMDFERADSLLDEVAARSSNPITQLCAEVLRMKVCQRTGDGLRFFQSKSAAERLLLRIGKKRTSLSDYERYRLLHAQSELHIIAATYYFYQQQDTLARREMEAVEQMQLQYTDVAQWVYYNYMVGSGGILCLDDAREQTLQEFDHLMRTLILSKQEGYVYFEANALQSLAVMLNRHAALLQAERPVQCRILHGDALDLAQRALQLFSLYDDLFQTACAWRTLGELNFAQGDYEASLDCYAQALHCVNLHHLRHYGTDTLTMAGSITEESVEKRWLANDSVLTVPEWIAGIRQQLSLTYSALDRKEESDYNHNAYLDILEMTGQNRELEQRTEELRQQTHAMNRRILAALLLLLVILCLVAAYLRKLRQRSRSYERQLHALQHPDGTPDFLQPLEDEREELEEQIAVCAARLTANKQSNVEKRAKVQLVHDIVPFLDRIGGEVMRMEREGRVEPHRRDYICELVGGIERYNAVLTDWIKMQQGQLSLRISTIQLGKLFDILRAGHFAFDQKGVTLSVEDTPLRVKADESLTLFMINTLADNARKFTPEGGRVTVRAVEMDDCVEVQVEDTGCGYKAPTAPPPAPPHHGRGVYTYDLLKELKGAVLTTPLPLRGGAGGGAAGHGFGLLNCRGIIEKYKKQSALFACCQFGVRSEIGQGSTFFFRLPRVATMLVALFLGSFASAQTAEELYDSIYQCNLTARYAEALDYAEEALQTIDPRLRLCDTLAAEGVEVQLWQRQEEGIDYYLLEGLRNEAALSALALHDWPLYHYNVRTSTHLHRLLNEDPTLPTYSRHLQRIHSVSRTLLGLIILFTLIALYLSCRLLLLTQIRKKRDVEEKIRQRREEMLHAKQAEVQELRDQLSRQRFEESRLYVQNQVLDNCMSTIKHESMYYPARIRQLAETMQDSDIQQLKELTDYYHHIYLLLSAQADAEVERPCLRLADVEVQGCTVRADADLFRTLMQQLQAFAKTRSEGQIIVDSQIVNSQFVEFRFTIEDETLTSELLHELFYPSSGHVNLLIAKQIIREHDAAYGNPGLRLVAERTDAQHVTIRFTLRAGLVDTTKRNEQWIPSKSSS